jgi:hypothetical protein
MFLSHVPTLFEVPLNAAVGRFTVPPSVGQRGISCLQASVNERVCVACVVWVVCVSGMGGPWQAWFSLVYSAAV